MKRCSSDEVIDFRVERPVSTWVVPFNLILNDGVLDGGVPTWGETMNILAGECLTYLLVTPAIPVLPYASYNVVEEVDIHICDGGLGVTAEFDGVVPAYGLTVPSHTYSPSASTVAFSGSMTFPVAAALGGLVPVGGGVVTVTITNTGTFNGASLNYNSQVDSGTKSVVTTGFSASPTD